MANDDPKYDPEATIERLIQEQIEHGKLITKIRRIIHSDPEFGRLSLVGGIKTILRRYREEVEKNLKLDTELRKILLGKKTKS